MALASLTDHIIYTYANQSEVNFDHNSVFDFSPNTAFSITAEIMRTGNTNGFVVLTKGQGSSAQNHYLAGFEQSGEVYFQLHSNGSQSNRIGKKSTDDFTTYNNEWLRCIFTYTGSATSAGLDIEVYRNVAGTWTEISATYNTNDAGSYVSMGTQEWILQTGYLNYNSQYNEGKMKNLALHTGALSTAEKARWVEELITGKEVWRVPFKGSCQDSIGDNHGCANNVTYGT